MEDVFFEYIDTQEGLDALCQKLAKQSEIALDSEADNLYHYKTQLCLLQLRFDEQIYLLDMLADIEYAGFWDAMKGIHLIMHGADFDLRLFEEFADFQASSIFDSMLASQLLGMKRIGLAALLEEFFEVKLPKDSQKSDWSQRPLTEKMLKYAANDVLYLHRLRDLLMEQINDLGRESWLEQRCEGQIEAGRSGFPERDENSWRIARSDKLDGRGQAAVYELWHWRQDLAEKLDRPPFKVLGNDYLIKLATSVSEGNWKEVFEAFPMGIQRRKRQGILDAVNRGETRDVETLPKRARRTESKKPLNLRELDRQESIKNFRDKVAATLGIDSTLIATRSLVAQLARDPEDVEGLQPWQRSLLEPKLSGDLDSKEELASEDETQSESADLNP